MQLTDMKLTPAEAKSENGICCAPGESDGPAYPYGLCIYLDDETIAKLGLTALPDVGTKFALNAIVEVTSNSQRQNQDGKTVSMDLQITDMGLETATEKTPEQKLYANSLMT